MKKITGIEIQKNNNQRANIFLDGKYAFSAELEILAKHDLSKNKMLDDIQLEEILKSQNDIKAFNYAITLLSRKDYTKKEMHEKLVKKDFSDSIIETVMTKLLNLGYLDDEKFCERFINNRIKCSKKGKNKIQSELYFKGIDKNLISQKIVEIDESSEFTRALDIANKKISSIKGNSIYEVKSKLIRHLVYKGFDYNISQKCADKIIRGEDY